MTNSEAWTAQRNAREPVAVAPPRSPTPGRKQLNVRIDGELFARVQHAAQVEGKPLTEVVETLLHVWVDHADQAGIRHLSGQVCPLQSLIDGLAGAARAEMLRKVGQP